MQLQFKAQFLTTLFLIALTQSVWADSPARPADVISKRHCTLTQDNYRRLEQSWSAFITANPDDVHGWVEWGDALRYLGRSTEAEDKYRRAYELNPADGAAISAYSANVVHKDDASWRGIHRQLQAAAALEPDFAELYYTLWITSLRAGDQALAENCLRRMVELGDMPRVLFDFGANIIESSAPHGIVITNGDNDTYPPHAYQALTGRRGDVDLVNLSLLNTKWYIRYLRDKGLPITLSDEEIAALASKEGNLISAQMQRHLLSNLRRMPTKRPLYYCVTVNEGAKILPSPRILEGLLERIDLTDGAEALETAASVDYELVAHHLANVYRLDSATDPLLNWEAENSVARLMRNYIALAMKVGGELHLRGDQEGAEINLFLAVKLSCFFGDEAQAARILSAWQDRAPDSDLYRKALALKNATKF